MVIFILPQVKIHQQERECVPESIGGNVMVGAWRHPVFSPKKSKSEVCAFFWFRTGRSRALFGLFREDVACAVGNGIEVEVGHAVYPERHAHYALG